MEENLQWCVCCLCTEEDFILHEFHIKCETLKATFLVDKIRLCYVCHNRLAQHSELFIENVQSNQTLLENFHDVLSSTIQSISAQVQSSITLSQTKTTTTETTVTVDEELCYVISSKESDIKLELKEEGLEQLEGEFIDGNDDEFQDSFVKDEDDFPLNSLIKEEIELDSIDLKSLRRTMKSRMVKKKRDSKIKERTKKRIEKNDTSKMYTKIHISETQHQKEREQKRQQELYLTCTYKCETCIKGFILQETYDRHMEKHSMSRGKFRCKICTIRYDTAAKLAKHRQGHTLRYKCPKCDSTFSYYNAIKDHFSTMHNSSKGYSELKCPLCPKVFTRAVSLSKHKYYRHSGKDKVSCDICHNTYVNKESLRAHIMRKHPTDPSCSALGKRYVCQECGMAFKAPSQLRNHSIKHSELKKFYCVECDRNFKSGGILNHHLKTAASHVKYSELPLLCQHCDKRFAIKRDLVRHTNRVHLNIKPYPCDKCDRAYINSWSLKDHMRYTHDGAKRPLRYPCSMCDKVFDRNSILKSHVRTHTGERPFSCPRCPAAFAQRSVLATHHRLVHLKLTRDGRPKAQPLK